MVGRHRINRGGCLVFAAGLGVLVAMTGCSEKGTRFSIVNHRSVGETEHFHELFDECYYSVSPGGNVDVVARRRIPADAENEALTQIVHIRTVFRAVPGTTHADSTMINGLVNYAIVGEGGGACFEGAGFVSCKEDRKRIELSGELEEARLHPNRRVGRVGDIFNQAVIQGTFQASRDTKKVVAILNELSRYFGPQPRYQPPDRDEPI